ncbi:TonB-dependent receptor plug domain-containing protein [Alkalilimnicola ehrlichii]|uniref:TonB-dependent receptor plug domain-containing protein n=1 Tax=Alkalilimnicola ehrlichii TaxID=351052 RepID=UPI001C6F2211|nr:TonB-dependent receptor plug domain-containing protein [Alkalilimnicola ehrlichii]
MGIFTKARGSWLTPVVLACGIPGTALSVAAAEESGAHSASLSPLVVSTTRSRVSEGQTPQKVTIISREQIEQQLAITSDRGQILSNLIPGYSTSRQKMTNSGETFRGRSPLFLVDGVPQSTPLRDSSRDSYTIDLDMVERIEVIHGASAEHGLGATGGIINFVTRRATKEHRGSTFQPASRPVTTSARKALATKWATEPAVSEATWTMSGP